MKFIESRLKKIENIVESGGNHEEKIFPELNQ